MESKVPAIQKGFFHITLFLSQDKFSLTCVFSVLSLVTVHVACRLYNNAANGGINLQNEYGLTISALQEH